jgi:hypothetical protein
MFNAGFDVLDTQKALRNQLINGFKNALGNTPQPILKIGFGFRTFITTIFSRRFVSIQTGDNHGLKEGDYVKLTLTSYDSEATKTLLNGFVTVERVMKDGFVTNIHWKDGINFTGTWQLASSLVGCEPNFHKDTNGNCVPDAVANCQPNYHKDLTGACVPDALGCSAGFTLTNGVCMPDNPDDPFGAGAKVPSWAIYVGLAVGVGLLGLVAYKAIKKTRSNA